MKIFAIYVIIGIIEWILICMQVKALQDKEEREYSVQFKPEYTPMEKCLALAKTLLIMAIPILRTFLTIAILFFEEVQDAIIEKIHEAPTVSKE